MAGGTTITLEGDREFLEFLEQLPDFIYHVFRADIAQTMEAAATELRAAYPEGAMRDAVFTRLYVTDRGLNLRGEVVSPTPEATWWEYGTAVRETQQGWNRGSAPAHPDTGLVSIAIKHRRAMNARHELVLEDLGFIVTGEP